MKKLLKITLILIIAIGFAVPVNAQGPGKQDADATAGGQRFSGDRPAMIGDPEQMQKIMGERLKDVMELNDEEWKVIGPKVMKVVALSLQPRGNPMRLLGGGPGMQRQSPARKINPNLQPDAVGESMQQLQKLLENKNTSTSEIKEQVIKVREARESIDQEKIAAQKELRELLTVRQEATLISMGLLD